MANVTETTTYSSTVTAVVDGTPMTAATVNAGLSKLASRTKFLKERLYDLLFGASLTISAVNTSTDRITITAHGIPANSAVQVFATNGGTLPGGLSLLTAYWVGVIDADTIQLYAASGPTSLIDLTSGFSGDVYLQIIPDLLATLAMSSSTLGTGVLGAIAVFKEGAQTITGAKTFADLTMSGTNNVKVASRSITRALTVTWIDNNGAAYATAQNPSLAAGDTMYAEFELPHNQTLTNVTITINPDNVMSLPGSPPTFNGGAVDVTTGAPAGSGFGPIADPSADATAYSARHDISSGVLSETIVGTSRVWGISLTNSTSDPIAIVGLRATVTVTSKTHWS